MVKLHTNHGVITLELDEERAPATVANFLEYVRDGHYDNTLFHRVIDGFMIQGGCPLGTGTGGPGYMFDDEIHPELGFDEPYVLAMANAGLRRDPVTGRVGGTNGSQFFITVGPTPHLRGKHTVFGAVADVESRAVVDTIAATPTGPQDRPVQDVVIRSVTVEP